MKITILFLIIELFCATDAFSQLTDAENQQAHRRYWYYRTRMINDFMKIGITTITLQNLTK